MSRKEAKISGAELSSFCGQVALILESGLPLYDGMETLAEAGKESPHARMYRDAADAVVRGETLYDALKSDEGWPKYLTEMVGVGERAGQLEKVLRGLEKYYAREDRVTDSIKSAVTYPLTLGIMLAAIVLIMLWKVLPVFHSVLRDMGMGMSGSGAALMRVGAVVGWVVLIGVLLALAAILVGVCLLRSRYEKQVRSLLIRRLPPIRRLSDQLSVSRISGVLSLMLSGGFRTEEALERAQEVLADTECEGKCKEIRRGILEEGKSFAAAMADTRLLREMENRMLQMGCATGHEDRVLDKIGDMYEEQVEQQIDRMIGIIEPTLVALLCVVIGAVLLSVMLPMVGVLSSL